MLTDLSSRQDLIDAYPDYLEGIGRFPGTYHITLRENATPVVHPPTQVPYCSTALGTGQTE